MARPQGVYSQIHDVRLVSNSRAKADIGKSPPWATSCRAPMQQILKTDALLFDYLVGAHKK